MWLELYPGKEMGKFAWEEWQFQNTGWKEPFLFFHKRIGPEESDPISSIFSLSA